MHIDMHVSHFNPQFLVTNLVIGTAITKPIAIFPGSHFVANGNWQTYTLFSIKIVQSMQKYTFIAYAINTGLLIDWLW